MSSLPKTDAPGPQMRGRQTISRIEAETPAERDEAVETIERLKAVVRTARRVNVTGMSIEQKKAILLGHDKR